MSDLEPIVARPAVRIPRPSDRPKQEEASLRFAPLAPIAASCRGPIFTRTRDIVAANMAELLDRAEDPAKMIRMIIVEMEETLVEVRATAARSIADIKEMRRACQRLDDLQHGWAEKAGLALEKGREDLPAPRCREKQKAAEMAEGLHAEVAQIEAVLKGYEADIQRLQAKLAEARARQNAIASRFESAVSARPGQRSAARQPHLGSVRQVRTARTPRRLCRGPRRRARHDRAEEPRGRNCRASRRPTRSTPNSTR